MTNPVNAAVPAGFSSHRISLTVSNTTIARVLIEPQLAAVATTTSPLFYGGSTLIDMIGASTDGTSRDVFFYDGFIRTTQETTNTGAMATTASTITRTNGSFIADAWGPGDQVMIFAPVGTAANAAVDGILGVVTAVVALTITVNGTPFGVLSPLAAGTRIVRMTPWFRAPVAANAGTNGTTANVKLLGNALDVATITIERKLGSSNLIAVHLPVQASALPAAVSITATIARY